MFIFLAVVARSLWSLVFFEQYRYICIYTVIGCPACGVQGDGKGGKDDDDNAKGDQEEDQAAKKKGEEEGDAPDGKDEDKEEGEGDDGEGEGEGEGPVNDDLEDNYEDKPMGVEVGLFTADMT